MVGVLSMKEGGAEGSGSGSGDGRERRRGKGKGKGKGRIRKKGGQAAQKPVHTLYLHHFMLNRLGCVGNLKMTLLLGMVPSQPRATLGAPKSSMGLFLFT